jgi:hypothetical protein|tara:strand:- start:588 stop:794 length:207 start_codon:yes stop_codon:yes gene_type:complete
MTMSSAAESPVNAYRFALTAVSLGRTPDEAFQALLDALEADAREAIDEEVSYAKFDYFTMEALEAPEG